VSQKVKTILAVLLLGFAGVSLGVQIVKEWYENQTVQFTAKHREIVLFRLNTSASGLGI
jgi:hypothetical protein